jgi:hypothetical protein
MPPNDAIGASMASENLTCFGNEGSFPRVSVKNMRVPANYYQAWSNIVDHAESQKNKIISQRIGRTSCFGRVFEKNWVSRAKFTA